MCIVNENQELNGIELSFDMKPPESVRKQLKHHGFRWNGKKNVWYAKRTEERFVFANELSCLEPEDYSSLSIPANRTDKKAGELNEKEQQERLKARYMEIICEKVWSSPKMQEYCRKRCAYLVELSDGGIVCIEKPYIEKDFCFSYGFCGVSTAESEYAANSMAHTAATDENYFKERNLAELVSTISRLQDCEHGKYKCYSCSYANTPLLKNVNIVRPFEAPEYRPERWLNARDLKLLEQEDIDRLVHGYSCVKAQLEQRLERYLKRYGLSKVNTWTFLSD